MNLPIMGFGSYRIALGNKTHRAALKKALLNGINLVDTSSNYTNGLSERLIGEVLKEIKPQKSRNEVIIVSKYGYIQGDNLDRFHKGLTFPETVFYDPNCYHCIHPDFMKDQLKRSLERLQLDYLDVYLIHNPEYYLMYNVKSHEEKEEHQKEMLRRISGAFEALEKEVSKGRIKAYGVSSNSFSKPEDDMHFLPYTGMVEMAEKAAKKAGNETHSFTTIQLPANLFETEGLSGCAQWAKENGLDVLVNRPLNAFDGKRMHRLASHPKPDNYDEIYNHAVEAMKKKGLEEVSEIIKELHQGRNTFANIDQFEYLFHYKIFPYIQKAQTGLNDDEKFKLNSFITAYRAFVLSTIDEETMKAVKKTGYNVDDPLEKAALKFLAKNPNVDCILNGMRRKEYVDCALEIMQWHEEKATVKS